MKTGLLMDVGSIQNYIFGSSKLKENIGASYIVGKIFDELPSEYNYNKIYSGGGNCFLTFDSEPDAKKFLIEFTTNLLVEYPGIIIHAAIGNYSGDKDHVYYLKKLHEQLKINKGKMIPITLLSRHGITAECARTGFSVEGFNLQSEQGKLEGLSSISLVKLSQIENANASLLKDFKDVLNNDYIFPEEFEDLGQISGVENSIAIVHIDGNNLGKLFMAQENSKNLAELSALISEITKEAFKKTIVEFISSWNSGLFGQKMELKQQNGNDNKKVFLPFRPLIIGGDDVTFVCNGVLGIWLAEKYIQNFSIRLDKYDHSLSACAGIAITKTKYPFFRGYELAEELCASAKKEAKKSGNENTSWLDFQIVYGQGVFDLYDLRTNHMTVKVNESKRKLFERPYRLDGNNDSFSKLLANSKILDQLPNSKIKELRSVLHGSVSGIKSFAIRTESYVNNMKNTELKNFIKVQLIPEQTTQLLDMMELIEYYPVNEMSKEN